jgi:hypothetical protein
MAEQLAPPNRAPMPSPSLRLSNSASPPATPLRPLAPTVPSPAVSTYRVRRGPSRAGLLLWTLLVAAGAGVGGYAYAGGFDDSTPVVETAATQRHIEAAIACLKLEGPAAYGCIEAGLADGSILPSDVSVPLQHPECVVYKAYYGEPEELTDIEFTAVSIAGAPCFRAIAGTATFDFAINYPEFVAPDCLEGRNPKASRDRDYLLRMLSCAAAARPVE